MPNTRECQEQGAAGKKTPWDNVPWRESSRFRIWNYPGKKKASFFILNLNQKAQVLSMIRLTARSHPHAGTAVELKDLQKRRNKSQNVQMKDAGLFSEKRTRSWGLFLLTWDLLSTGYLLVLSRVHQPWPAAGKLPLLGRCVWLKASLRACIF